MRKITSVILVLSLLVSLFAISVAASAAPEIKVGNVTAVPGEEVIVPVDFLNNPGFNSFSLTIEYDSTYLTLERSNEAFVVPGNKNFIKRAVWLCMDGDTDYSGTYLNLKFTVSEDAPAGVLPVSVSYNPGDICNYDEDDVNFNVVPGGISIKPAPSELPTIELGNVTAVPGEEVIVPVQFLNNPGFNSFSLTIEYDSTYLTLERSNEAFAVPGNKNFIKRAVWLCMDGDTYYNGVYLNLKFTVSENAPEGSLPVTVSYNPGDICNYDEDDVDFEIVAGSITVKGKPFLLGDVNGDGKVNAIDANLAKRIVLGNMDWVVAADINGDGKVNAVDMNLLKQLILGN